ncbi:hypothetical protein B0T26DRAFT_671085 [Lasiosphaeria miniovina]|uniref:Uncharacterized protein n=1 Tax=Lasiosphaeria miniovina TaxID=1954250 RepID=A0AA40EGP0_9PEZI|nr:uncharacterized protein B0T26DRAFT_671085 [Lasiosphaeria miniovina]KAK0734853.1 hypothetical protein B0T26DRAFT_671085 [Lasiosphaeria miniovina]
MSVAISTRMGCKGCRHLGKEGVGLEIVRYTYQTEVEVLRTGMVVNDVVALQADPRDDVTKRENRGTSNLQGKKAENMLQFGFANTAVTVGMLHLEGKVKEMVPSSQGEERQTRVDQKAFFSIPGPKAGTGQQTAPETPEASAYQSIEDEESGAELPVWAS